LLEREDVGGAGGILGAVFAVLLGAEEANDLGGDALVAVFAAGALDLEDVGRAAQLAELLVDVGAARASSAPGSTGSRRKSRESPDSPARRVLPSWILAWTVLTPSI